METFGRGGWIKFKLSCHFLLLVLLCEQHRASTGRVKMTNQEKQHFVIYDSAYSSFKRLDYVAGLSF